MILYIPQWQGAGEKFHIPESLEHLKRHLKNHPAVEVPVSGKESELKHGIRHYDIILDNLVLIKNTVIDSSPDRIFTIGGDCSTELIPVSYLNRKYKGDMNVIWFDAHGDLNTNISSKSGNFHGMPLRILLGEGDMGITEELPGFIEQSQIVMIGLREPDEEENNYIALSGIKVISPEKFTDNPDCAGREIKKGNLYIHIDLDVLDQKTFPYSVCSSVGGIALNLLTRSISELNRKFNIAGISIVEYNDESGAGIDMLSDLISICTEIASGNQ